MLTRTRKRSARITLVLIGAAALAACGDSDHERRDLYASKQDCVQDWGDEKKCEAAPASAGSHTGHSHSGGGYFYGPSYRTGSGSSSSIGTTRSGSRAIGSSSISRGGFGSSASSHSSGG